MKKLIIISTLLFVICQSCKENSLSKNDLEIYKDLCLEPNEVKIIKIYDILDEQATIRYETKRYFKPFYYIDFKNYNETYFYSCKLPKEFEQDGLKVVVRGQYYLDQCKGGPCGGRAYTPFRLINIAKL